jgi:hypothetical protein
MLALRPHSTSCVSKQENAHPEAALLVVGNFNARNLNSFYLISTSMPQGKINKKEL